MTAPSAAETFDRIVGGLDPPMTIVTVAVGDERAGCLVGFSTQCSIDPPRFTVCISKRNHTYPIAERAAALAVHVLHPGDGDLARLFGGETGDEIAKFERCRWHPGPQAVPVLDGCDWFAGPVRSRVDTGDHVLFVLDVEAAEQASNGNGQLGYQRVRDLDPGHPA